MIVFRIVWRLVRFVGTVIVVIVVAAAIGLVVLKATNPKPQVREGWTLGAPMSEQRGEMASALVDGQLVTIGGLRGVASASTKVSVYDVETGRWVGGEPLAIALHHAAAAATDKNVYLSGGARSVRNWAPTKIVQRLRPGHEWSFVTTMPEGRQGHAMVAIGDKLYIVGGVGESDRTLIYDISKRKWTFGAPLPEGRDHLRAVVRKGRIWAVGGRHGKPTGRVDIYYPSRDEWGPGPPLPEPMSAMAVGVIGKDIHVVGSEDPSFIGGGVSKSHYVLRGKSDRWERDAAPPLAVHGAAFGVWDGKLVVAGGASRNGALSAISWTNVTQIFTD